MGPSAKIESIISYRNAKILASSFVLFHLALIFLFKSNLPLRAELSDMFTPIVSSFGAGGLIYALLHAGDQKKKVQIALILMASGMFSYTLAETVWSILEVGLHQQPFPSLADVFYILFYPLFIIGLIFLPTEQISVRERHKIVIDIIILMIAAILIFGDFIIGPILANGKESTLALALSVAYPLLDLVLLFALMELVYRRLSSLDRGSGLLLLAAVTLFIVSDVYFALQNITKTYVSGGLVDTGYILSYSLIGLAGILQANKWKLPPESISKKPKYKQSTWTHYLPATGVGAAYLLLLWNQSHLLPIGLSVTTLSVGGIIGLVLTRQIMALNENSSLYFAAKKEIDDRKQMEGALKAERDRAENYLNIAEVIFIALDTYARITLINRRGYEILGYEEGELIGKDWIKTFLHPEDYEHVIDFNNKIIAGKIEPLDYYESYILTKKGEERNIAWHTAVLKNDEGYIIGTLSSGEDITDRRRAEEALKEGEEKYRNLVERANAGITIIQDGTVRYANPALTKLWGGSVEEIVGRPFTDFIDPDEIPNVIERYQLRMANKNVSPIYETILRHRNGTKIFVELNAGLITFQETPADLVIVQNITERKWAAEEVKKARDELEIRVRERTAELEAKNAEMERFIYTVSHELRSPLISASGIVGFLRQDLEEGDAKRTETDLKLIEGAMTKMDQLLGEILELSRIGRVANPPVDVPFGEIVMETLDQEAEKLKSRGVEVSMASDLPKVHVDRMRIMEVLVNLIDNSIKYMGDQPRPRIEVGHRLDNNQTIFIVRDNGMGIDPSQHEKVFGLFYKVNGKSEGTGVGLAIVKRIIEVHGGRIWIESELGQGCTVYFTLPIADVG